MTRFGTETLRIPLATGQRMAPRETTAVVLGGGIAGVAAAAILAERGVRVTLLEALPHLGGRAGAETSYLPSGEPYQMERGFHAFFRQYYNLRRLLRRIDPELAFLHPLPDYPILGPSGRMQSFADLPTTPPFQILSLVRKTPYLRLSDLLGVHKRNALAMLRFDMETTYRKFDGMTATSYLDSLGFPATGRQMLFDVFAHSFFNPEEAMSAAELLMMFHFYFTANREGLLFDVSNGPFSTTIWQPFRKWLGALGVDVRTGLPVERLDRIGPAPSGSKSKWSAVHAGGRVEADLAVIALDVRGLQRLIERSPHLQSRGFYGTVSGLSTTLPFAVLRLWLGRKVRDDRPPFAGTTGVGLLDNISVYEKLEGESATWSRAHNGSVLELHAYAVPAEVAADRDRLRQELLGGLHLLYPETAVAEIVHEHLLVADDCPAFPPSSRSSRPGVTTPFAGLALAGDFVFLPIPCALMERAASSGILAANTLLAPLGVAAEPLLSVPRRGLFASPFASTRGLQEELSGHV